MSVIRRRWHFTGNVQGVGFRYFAQCAAQKLGLTGWVANNWDGSVTLAAQQSLGADRSHDHRDPAAGRARV